MVQMMPAGRSVPPSATPFRLPSVYRFDPTCHAASMKRGQEPGAFAAAGNGGLRPLPQIVDRGLPDCFRDRWAALEQR